MECARSWEDGAAHGCSRQARLLRGLGVFPLLPLSSSCFLGHEGGQQLSLEVMDWHQDASWPSPCWDKGECSPFVGAAFGGGDLSSSLGLLGSHLDTLRGHALIMGIAQGESPSCSPAVAQEG